MYGYRTCSNRSHTYISKTGLRLSESKGHRLNSNTKGFRTALIDDWIFKQVATGFQFR